MVREEGLRGIRFLPIIAVALFAILVFCPKAAFAGSPASEIEDEAQSYLHWVSLMQEDPDEWDSHLHCFVGKPNADDAYCIGRINGMCWEYFESEEYLDPEDNYDHIPRALLEGKLKRWFDVVPDLRDRVPYQFFRTNVYDPAEDAILIWHSEGGKGYKSLDSRMLMYSQVSPGTYDVYMKVVLDRWNDDPDFSDTSQYVVHRLRMQKAGDDWRYLSLELLDIDAAGKSPINVGGASGVGIKGDWKEIEGCLVSLVADKLEKASYGKEFQALSNILGVFDVKLYVDEAETHDGFGKMTIDFPVGKQNDGYWVTIHHLHNDGRMTSHRVIAQNGVATLEVTDLSSFALERGEKALVGSSSSDSDGDTTAVGYGLEGIDAPADGSATAVSPRTGQYLEGPSHAALTFSVLAPVALISLVIARKRVSA